MLKSILHFKELLSAFFLLSLSVVFLPLDLLFDLLLFALIIRGSLYLIQLATRHDVKSEDITHS